MGGSESQPTPPPSPKLTNEPWRFTTGRDMSVKKDLKNILENLRPETNGKDDVDYFNIILTGQIGSGKSSFYNSVNSIFANRVISSKAELGAAAQSLTKEYNVYEIWKGQREKKLRWRICDTMGLAEDSTESEIKNLLKAAEGHVPHKNRFTPGQDFTEDTPGYVKNPALKHKAHCIAIVIDARIVVMRKKMWAKLRSLRVGLISRNIPTFILLSHIDEACEKVNADVSNVYRSIKIRDLVSKVGKKLMGLPENQIFPIKNYSNEVELNDEMDILLLYAMHQMLHACQDHIEIKIVLEDLKNSLENLRPQTDGKVDVDFFNIVLTGQIGSGKSSFYNSINSIFANRVISSKANAGDAARSLTKEYNVYEICKGQGEKKLCWRICDTMGLDEDSTESEIRNLLTAVEGHVPNKHKFTPGQDFTEDTPGYVKNPTLKHKAHCIAIVIDASTVHFMGEKMWAKLRSLRVGLISRNIPTFILLSHIDKACEDVYADVRNRSIEIRDLVTKVGKKLMGLPENQIFPIKNYSNEVELNDEMDILLLNAMRQMLYACQGHIESKM